MINSEDKADIKAKMGAKIAKAAVKASDDSVQFHFKESKKFHPKSEEAQSHINKAYGWDKVDKAKVKTKKEAMAKKIPIKAGDPKMPWHNFTAKKELSGAKAIIDKYKGRDLDK